MRMTLMRMNYISTWIILSTTFEPCQVESYKPYTCLFGQVLGLAKSILRPATVANRNNLLRAVTANNADSVPNTISFFAFVTGAIEPLYITALKCCEFNLREEAIAMLEEQPWREGAWDSAAISSIARRRLADK